MNTEETTLSGTSTGSGYICPVDTSAGIAEVIPDGTVCPQTTSEKALSMDNLPKTFLLMTLENQGKN